MKWGGWVLTDHESGPSLDFPEGTYEVALAECNSSAQILNWIFHLKEKTWATQQVMDDFLTAINDILEPRANFCTGGLERKADGVVIARKYISNPNWKRHLIPELADEV